MQTTLWFVVDGRTEFCFSSKSAALAKLYSLKAASTGRPRIEERVSTGFEAARWA